jgi:hypothetical protein
LSGGGDTLELATVEPSDELAPVEPVVEDSVAEEAVEPGEEVDPSLEEDGAAELVEGAPELVCGAGAGLVGGLGLKGEQSSLESDSSYELGSFTKHAELSRRDCWAEEPSVASTVT